MQSFITLFRVLILFLALPLYSNAALLHNLNRSDSEGNWAEFRESWMSGPFQSKYTVLQDDKGNPSPPFLELLKFYNIPHDGSWQSIVNETQKHWIPSMELATEDNPSELFYNLNLIQPNFPSIQEYNYAILPCAHKMQERLAFLKNAWDKGIRFSTLILLDASCIPLPSEWCDLTVVCIHQSGSLRKGLKSWLKTDPEPGTVLLVSDQPSIMYDDTLAKKILPMLFPVDTVGPGVMTYEPTNVLIKLARTIALI